jgi:hypothetical protein
MPQGDLAVWRIFLERRGRQWREYAYDVELHGGTTPIASVDPALAKDWARLIAKRVDVVGFRAAGATLFEVRTHAAWQTLGQLIGYRDLFPLDYPDQVLEQCVIVSDEMDAGIRRVAENQGLRVWLTSE